MISVRGGVLNRRTPVGLIKTQYCEKLILKLFMGKQQQKLHKSPRVALVLYFELLRFFNPTVI